MKSLYEPSTVYRLNNKSYFLAGFFTLFISTMKLIVLTLFLVISHKTNSIPFEVKSLYEPSTVYRLDIFEHDTIDGIYNQPNAWIFQFYSSMCGHCIHFAPTFKEFAEEISSKFGG